MTRKEKTLMFLGKVYVPTKSRDKLQDLIHYLDDKEIRELTPRDEFKEFDVLIIETRGKSLYETFQGWRVDHIYTGAIGKRFADIAVAGMNYMPLHIGRGNLKISIIEKKGE